jgi:hypothetical protein
MVLGYARRDVRLLRSAVEHANSALGQDHRLTISSKIHLALVLGWSGQRTEGITLFREALAAGRRTNGGRDIETAWIAHLLATNLSEAGGGTSAVDSETESLYREALSVYAQTGKDQAYASGNFSNREAVWKTRQKSWRTASRDSKLPGKGWKTRNGYCS